MSAENTPSGSNFNLRKSTGEQQQKAFLQSWKSPCHCSTNKLDNELFRDLVLKKISELELCSKTQMAQIEALNDILKQYSKNQDLITELEFEILSDTSFLSTMKNKIPSKPKKNDIIEFLDQYFIKIKDWKDYPSHVKNKIALKVLKSFIKDSIPKKSNQEEVNLTRVFNYNIRNKHPVAFLPTHNGLC